MNTSKFSETQVCAILKKKDAGVKVAEICRKASDNATSNAFWLLPKVLSA